MNNLQMVIDAGQKMRKVYQRRYPSDTSKDYYFMYRNMGSQTNLVLYKWYLYYH